MENSNKILIFSTSYLPFVGGAEVAIKEITDRISGVDFDIITSRFDFKLPKNEKIGNVNVYRVGFGFKTLDKLLLPFWGAIKTISLNNKNNYKYYFCVMVTFASGAAYISNIISSKKVPIILNLQEGDSEEHFQNRWFGLINLSWKLALKRSSLVVAISSYLAERAKKFGYKGDIKIIPNGVDIEKFSIFNSQFSKEERQKIRKEIGLEEKDIGLITTSRLVLKNGVGDVIKALPKLPKNIKFVIFGEGYLEKELKELAIKLNVSNRIIFKGFVEHPVLNKYLKASDIFIRTSRSEGQGISFLEAMACKLPVIATPVGGIVDFLHDPFFEDDTDNQTGYFCQPENPESIAEAVKRVMGDLQKNSVVENAYNMVKEKYDWDLIAREMNEVFDINRAPKDVSHDMISLNQIK